MDLIICYDVSSSAIRQTQRFGRTGRRNAGRVVMLVTRGVEEEVYERSLANASIMKRALAQAAAVQLVQTRPLLPPGLPTRGDQRRLAPPPDEPPSPASAEPAVARGRGRAAASADGAALVSPPSTPERDRAQRWALKEGDAPPRRLSVDRWTVGQARPAAASGRWASRGHVQDMSRTPLGHVP